MGVFASIVCNKGSAGLRSFESSVPAVRQLLLSPALVPCCVLQLTTIGLALEKRGEDIAPAHGSSSSGDHEHGHTHGSSSSSSKKKGSKDSKSAQQQLPPGAVDTAKCPCCVEKLLGNWQLAVERLPSLTPCHHKLFELLGVEPLAVLWTAAIIRHR